MASEIGTIHVRMQRGKLTVQGDGRTGRGQRYIKQTIPLDVADMAAPKFKEQLATAVNEMFAQLPLPL